MEGLGGNHSLETALADLVDNSIDAGASDVLIRFVRQNGQVRALYVADNGRGLTPEAIDIAMTVGGQRSYSSKDLGHFGLGMKAASFSQAKSLTVLSRAARHPAVGRRWELSEAGHSFRVDVVTEEFAEAELLRDWALPPTGTGTVVRWDSMARVPVTEDPQRIETFLSQTVQSVSTHLGLVFHRRLEAGDLRLLLDIEDTERGMGPRFLVSPVNPFGYRTSGKLGYPKTLIAQANGTQMVFQCHIWPGRSSVPEFKLPDGPEHRQGLYVYRRDRLLQAGGDWGGISRPTKRLQLARVAIDIGNELTQFITMNPEKSRILVGPEFTHLAEKATADDGTGFFDFLNDAEQTFRDSRTRNSARKPLHFPPGKGLGPHLRRTIENEFTFMSEDRPVDIRWRGFSPGDSRFFDIDRDSQTLWLNDSYRSAVLGHRRAGLNDAPVVKSLLYLLMEHLFRGERFGNRDKDNVDVWQEILIAAAESEIP
ncbi:ATP-binding protein [Nocardia arthritidis]|uniref:ATP-binding protein n=1 Tax=Nocardia arthritidis TaxID=228602 RepID=A0A6G9YN39_9NOCA|nr:ATP-binding protein [Nocardia arthritidis]QIS14715.1 ATP-binding protein [Nocardia arthritidis]